MAASFAKAASAASFLRFANSCFCSSSSYGDTPYFSLRNISPKQGADLPQLCRKLVAGNLRCLTRYTHAAASPNSEPCMDGVGDASAAASLVFRRVRVWLTAVAAPSSSVTACSLSFGASDMSDDAIGSIQTVARPEASSAARPSHLASSVAASGPLPSCAAMGVLLTVALSFSLSLSLSLF